MSNAIVTAPSSPFRPFSLTILHPRRSSWGPYERGPDDVWLKAVTGCSGGLPACYTDCPDIQQNNVICSEMWEASRSYG